jgi:hypothetical protein
MTQRGYVRFTLKQFSLNECNTNPTPMAKNTKFLVDMGEERVDIHLFLKMVRKHDMTYFM